MIYFSDFGSSGPSEWVFTGAESSITVAIPQTGNALILHGELRSARTGFTEAGVLIRFNGQTANYWGEYVGATAAALNYFGGSLSYAGIQFGVPANDAPAGEAASLWAVVPRYTKSGFFKKIDITKGMRRGVTAALHENQLFVGGDTNSTSPVTSITILSENGENLTGTVHLEII